MGISIDEASAQKIVVDRPDPKFGDFSSNAAMILAKGQKTNPRALAEKIVREIDKKLFKQVTIEGPGFINFKVKDEAIIESLTEREPKSKKLPGKILVEYFQPNIAKPLHVGHLRTAIIGDAIRRSLEYLGHEVESDTHMGDWGTQFGILIWAYKKWGNDKEIEKNPITTLNKYYIKANDEIEKDPSLRDAAKKEFVKLEEGDKENRKIWKQFVDWSLEKFSKINDLLDLLPFEHYWPESFYEDKMKIIVETLKKKGLLQESQGAQIVNLEKQGLGIAIIIKSDGGTTYLLRDLATFIFRKKEGFGKQIYVVDTRQSHAFDQLFAILEMLGEMKPDEAYHVTFGFMSFKGSAFSTRKGNIVLAEDLVAQTKEKVAEIIEKKNPELKGKKEAVKAVALAALKYFDLSHNRQSDIEFDWKEVLDFEGNSGPYLQYAHARLSSILRKEQPSGKISDKVEMTETERQLALMAAALRESVEESVREYFPNILANYLYDLATLANKFYHESRVLNETDQDKKLMRLFLTKAVKETLGNGLKLLGIVPLEEM